MSFYDDASWLLIPSGIKEDVVYAQKPTSGLGDLTFTRASDATYTDSTGVVRRSPYNLLTFSEQFDNAAWSKSALTIGINATVAPNGTLTADKLQEDSSTGNHIINQPVTNANSLFSFSVYAKKSERDFLFLQAFGVLPNNFTYAPSAYFNLNTGVVSTVSSATATIESVGNGWYRCTLNCTSIFAQTSASVGFYMMTATSSGVNSYAGTTGSGIFIWGAQLVEGTSALDYFPTTNRQDVPRIDFRNADGTLSSCGRLLLEPQRTNNAQFSESFDNAYWTKTSVTLTSTLGGPIANSKYFTITCDGTTGTFKGVGRTFLNASANTYSLSVFAKAGTSSAFVVSSRASLTANDIFARFNLANGTIISQNGGTASIVNYGDGWYRCTFVVVNAGTFTNEASIFFGHPHGAANGVTVLATGATSEIGAYPTTYIPTTTAAVTRLADAASKTGVSSIIGQSAGTIFWDVNDVTGTPAGTGNPDFAIRNTAFTNWIGITTNGFASPFRITVRPTSGSIIDYTANITRAKAAVAWSSAGAVLYVNGVQVATSAVNPNFSFDVIELDGSVISYKTNQAALFTTRLSNSELQSLTTL